MFGNLSVSRLFRNLFYYSIFLLIAGGIMAYFGLVNNVYILSIFGFLIFVVVFAIELPLVVGYWISAVLAEKLVAKMGISNKLVAFLIVPFVMMVICTLVALMYSVASNLWSVSKYQVNMYTGEDFAYPTHVLKDESGKLTVSIIQSDLQKQERAFSVALYSNVTEQYVDKFSFHTDWLNTGKVEWITFGTDSILRVSAKEGNFAYLLTDEIWERISLDMKTQSECNQLKNRLKEYKSQYMNAAILVHCPK